MEHPFKLLRVAEGLTQNQVAQATDLSPQLILKTEQGLYAQPSVKLLSYYSKLCSVAEDTLSEQYLHWQIDHRLESKEALLRAIRHLQADRAKTGLQRFMRLLGHNSVMSFCKAFCLHPTQVNRLGSSGGSTDFLEEALIDVVGRELAAWTISRLSV